MKIVRLTFSGVRSYPDTCEIDFTGKTLVGILGDTGAGKTSILEAIAVALYGKCSFTDRVAQLRSDDCASMMVDLEFRVDGQEWRVHRVFPKGRATQARLTHPDGRHTDGARAVDEAVRALLGIDYLTFKSSVLIPQGSFDELLNARDADRTRILKSLFGVDELQRVRVLAEEAVSRLKDLIGKAQQAGARLHDDPAAEARSARERHEQAARGAEDLSGRLGALRQLQTNAAQASQQARRSTDAAAALTGRRVTDHGLITASIRQAQDDLQQLQETNADAETTVQAGLTAVTDEQEKAASAGLAPDALAAAAQVLNDLPGRLTALAEEKTAHAQSLAELEEEEERLARRAGELEGAEEHLAKLRGQAQDADEEAAAAAEALNTLTTAARQAGEAAGALAQQRAGHALTSSKLTALVQAPPRSDVEQARITVLKTQDVLDGIRRREAAHTAGDGLSAGDDCPVCDRLLPEGYQPPQPHDADALTQAMAAVEGASAELSNAEQEQARHTHEVEALQRALTEHEQQVTDAAARLEDCLPALREQALKLASASAHPQPAVYAKELEDTAVAALSRMAGGEPPTAAEREEVTSSLLEGARGRVVQLEEAADASRDELVRAKAELSAEHASLTAATQATGKTRAQAARRSERLQSEQRGLLANLSALPAPIRAVLPLPPELPTADRLEAATEAVRHEQGRQQKLAERLEQLRTRAQLLLGERSELVERRRHEVTEPLHRLEARLQRWADGADDAAALVEESERPVLPSRSAASGPEAAAEFAVALETAAALLLAALDAHQTAADAATAELTMQLAAHAEGVAGAYPGTAVLQVTGETDPLDPTLLDGLSSQVGTLRGEAAHALHDTEQATSQIPHKERLAAALTAGERQLAAWQAVSSHLTDGKFLGHLTDLRTRALLAHGSELLQQLSGGRLGFAADFDIVSLTSHARRSSRTLSGGETFQASLALSLALMEMHGRSGTRLESLFLDEGFGTLDTARLDSALQLLRTHVGTDKLLTVISHLRPVAETVHDVLWVTKDHRGSQARWLTAAQRDSLVREGLHNLADLT
ncbi:AAA family ATPase [Streptomyces luteocolor]|uniref:AAA family ATPase n=1 Tax=Streptomyces luteocolor TaxID=285500 RepID=UPI0008533DDC|nr:SMC family ATPase [Streptomyces luteocolor]